MRVTSAYPTQMLRAPAARNKGWYLSSPLKYLYLLSMNVICNQTSRVVGVILGDLITHNPFFLIPEIFPEQQTLHRKH
jgi:hypothetical protein